MSKVDLIIQARIGSTRLPGKSMFDLAGAPMVGRIIERVKRCKHISEIILATPETSENDKLSELAEKYGVSSFRGSEADLVDRYYRCALKHESQVVLRLPGDNPVSEPQEIDRLVEFHLREGGDFSSNITNFKSNGYPDGIGIEAIDIRALKNVWLSEKNELKREHVASNFIDYATSKVASEEYLVKTLSCPEDIRRPDLVLDVNTLSEYLYIKKMYDDLYLNDNNFGIKEIINWHDFVGFKINRI